MLIRHLMTENPAAVSPETTLGQAYEELRVRKFDCLPVLDQAKHLVGIIQVTDIYEACMNLGRQVALAKPVGEFMVTDVVTVALDAPLELAATLMLKCDVPALPVVDEGKLVGMVTEHEIFKSAAMMLGAGSGTHRVTLVVPDARGQLARIAEIVRDLGLSITNVATFHSEIMQQYKIVLRVHAEVIETLLESLERSGFKVLHACID
jgi:acetoin utilization protein AcuB